MKRIFTICFLIINFFSVKASFIPAADMSYVYLGEGNYKIIVTAYRDCNGIQISPDQVVITSGNKTLSFALQTERVEDITNVTKSCIQTKCAGGSYYFGLEKHIFSTIVNLGSYTNSCEFYIYWQQCCRNGAITTGAASGNFYVDMLINRCYDSTNSAPQFTMRPLSVVAVNEPVTYNSVMVDSMDGYDSLSYEMVLPLSSAGKGISYTGKYSSDAPLTYIGFPKTGLNAPAGFNLDGLGNIRFTPTASGEQTVMVMKVTEWKKINGVMRIVSELKRDMQVYVFNSYNHEPKPKNFNNKFTACAGKQYIFEIPFTDIDTGTVLYARVISEIPGLTYKVIRDSASEISTVKVEITPTSGQANKKPYQFYVVVNDSNCNGKDGYGEFIYAYNLYIKEAIDTSAPAVINFSKTCNSFEFEGKDSLGFGYTHWEWFDDTVRLGSDKNSVYTFTEIGSKKIILKAYKDGCYVESSASVSTAIIYQPKLEITSSKNAACRNTDIVLEANVSGATEPITYYWPGLNIYGDSIHQYHNDSKYKVTMLDSNGCRDSIEKQVILFENPGAELGRDTLKCTNDLNGIILTAKSDSKLTLFYDWDGLGNTKSIKVNPVPGQNRYTVKVSDTNSCNSLDTIIVEGYTLTINAGDDTLSCGQLTNYALNGLTNADPANSQFEWQYLAKTQNINVNIPATKTFTFKVKDSLGCLVSDDVTITIANPPFVNIKSVSVCANDSFVLSATVTGKAPFAYSWQLGNNTFSENGIIALAPEGTGNHYAILEVKDSNSCIKKDSGLITVKALPVVSASVVDHVCKATGKTINLNENVSPAGGIWTENGVNINAMFRSSNADSGSHQLVYQYTSPLNACTNKDIVSIYVVQPSEIDFNASVLKGSAPLKVDFIPNVESYSPTVTYKWFFGDNLNTTDLSENPSFTYNKKGTYSVKLVIGSNGYCPEEELIKDKYIEVASGASVTYIDNSLIQVYPVPSNGKVLVSLPRQIDNLNYEWFDMSGKKVGDKLNVGLETEIVIKTPGIYLLKIFSGNEFIGTRKLIIE